MTENEATLKSKKRNKRKVKKIALLLFLTSLTAVLLVVETYAWFVGTATVSTSEFQIGVSSGDSLELSLDGDNWTTTLSLDKDSILGQNGTHKAYTGHTNVWPLEETGLIPLSTVGDSDPAANGRLMLYGKSSITATGGGYRILSNRINNYGTSGEGQLVTEQDGYVAFDLFIRNGTGVDYISTYKQEDDEAVYLTVNSKVEAVSSGSIDYGLANSVRVAFVQIGRIASNGATEGAAKSISCSAEGAGAGVTNTSLCNVTKTTIWEPNDTKHDSNLVTYFNRVCKSKTGTAGSYTYEGACTELKDGTAVTTYAISKNIASGSHVDIYDGLNGFDVGTGDTAFLAATDTFTDTMKVKTGSDRPAFFYLAPNSITKIRVYIYLEGQDVDNYDLASLGETVKVNFGFTKDQWDLANTQQTS